MNIREATSSDLPEIVEIYNSTIPGRLVSADIEPISVEQRREWFDEHDPDRRPLWVAEEGGKVMGWLSFGDFFDGRPAYHATVELGVYIREGNRGRGLGKTLVEEAIHAAPRLGVRTIAAGVFARNEPSINLLESFGFEWWARYPNVAELDGVELDLIVLGLRVG